jgi:hypothetical protein
MVSVLHPPQLGHVIVDSDKKADMVLLFTLWQGRTDDARSTSG